MNLDFNFEAAQIEKPWFVSSGETYRGPLSVTEVNAALESGHISADSFVWADGMPEWLPIRNVDTFAASAEYASEFVTAQEPVGPSSFEGEEISEKIGKNLSAMMRSRIPFLDDVLTADLDSGSALPEIAQTTQQAVAQNVATLPFFRRPLLLVASLVAGGTLLGLASALLISSAHHSGAQTPSDVSIGEDLELREILQTGDERRAALALSNSDLEHAAFYVGAGLPDGAEVVFRLRAQPQTLNGAFQFSASKSAKIKKRLAKSDAFQSPNGQSLPRGEYMVSVVDGAKVLAQKTYFLGGVRDETYESQLRTYHDQLRTQARMELLELRQLEGTLESQLTQTLVNYEDMRRLSPARRGHVWTKFSSQWLGLQRQLVTTSQGWTEDMLAKDLYYGDVYRQLKTATTNVLKTHEMQALFGSTESLQNALAEQMALAQKSVIDVDSRLQVLERAPGDTNGLPTR